jgi:serine/threonine protein kinase
MPDSGIIGKTIAHYRIERRLGQGGMAAVYEATDQKLRRQVAIKVMHPHLGAQKNFQQRFLQEARSAARLDHPNIIRVLSFDNIDNSLYLVMELITGGNLRQYIKKLYEDGRVLDYPEAIEVTRQIADALDYAHRQRMIHRDIKPDNVMLKPIKIAGGQFDFQPVLTDFGLAKLTTGGENAITDQQPIGTYPYMSPEQCLSEPVNTYSDIYGLGIMLYELSVGRLPYHPKSLPEAARMHGREILPLPSHFRRDFPLELEKIIVKSLQKKPVDRYQTAAEMARDLQALATISSPPVPPAPQILEPAALLDTAEVEPEEPVEDAFATDLATEKMTSPLPAEMPQFESPPIPDDQVGYDRLVFVNEEGLNFAAILDQVETTIGRGDDQIIRIEGEKVSRRHAQIERKPNGRYTITDVESGNGLWVDDARLEADNPVLLQPNSVVRIGTYWMRLELKAAAIIESIEAISEPEPVIADSEELPDEQPAAAEEMLNQINTEPMLATIPEQAPDFSPPPLTADQIGYERLIFYSEAFPIMTAKLDRVRLSVGRDESRDIVLRGKGVSRAHARIERQPSGHYYIVDIGSTNGIWVDSERLEVNMPAILTPTKTVRLGEYWIRFEAKRDLQLPLAPIIPAMDASIDDMIDVNATVRMIRPLSEDVPHFSPPPLTIDQRANDRLLFFSEDHPLQVIPLDQEILTIGRDDALDIVLHGKRISRQHLRVECKPDGNIYVTDLDSTNGTWMSDTLLVPDTQVLWETHEIIRIGNYWMSFEQGTRMFDPLIGGMLEDTRALVGTIIKNYRIDRYLGQGSLASVYKATETPLDRPVALKIMHPHLVIQPVMKQRFLQEARTASRLDHPNVVRVLSFDDIDNEVFMVMELIPGGSLRVFLNKLHDVGKRVELEQVVDMSIQMANGLHYAHQQGMIHRDIRPESIVLKPGVVIGPIVNYQPILTDFALARLEESGQIFITDKPDISFAYMSPEQCLGERVDIRSDIYELGIVLYEMMAARPPYQPRSIAEAVRMHAREPLQMPSELRPDLPDALEKVILKALEKDPNNRYQTAAEMARALQRAAPDLAGEESIPEIILPINEQDTVIMDEALPAQMPHATRQPVTDTQKEHDRLVLYSDDHPTRTVSLDKAVLTVGRADDQDIILNSTKVSRRHARIEQVFDDTYRIIDVESSNGTWLGTWRLLPNMAEIWETSETVRIGDYWLRIETVEDLQDIDYFPLPSGVDEEYITDGGDMQPLDEIDSDPIPDQDKIGLTIDTPHIQVAPGSSTTLSVEVVNQSNLVDHFKVELSGLPAGWVTQPTAPLHLLPHNRDTTSITLSPPLSSSSSSGEHAFEVRVTARAQSVFSVATQGALTVSPFHSFVADLQPERIKGRGYAELTLHNTGNTPGIYTILARDREQAMRFGVDGKQFTLPAGYTEHIPIRIKSKKRPILGSAQALPFEITITPTILDQPGEPQSRRGELVVRPIFPIWTIGAVILMFVLCAIISLFTYTQVSKMQANRKTETAIALATSDIATVTAVAGEDTDGDTLGNAQEVELGTDPKIADTDEDGLIDGEEVRVWLTNPLLRDTDGDGATDGDEVNILGTDPLNPDTDGDGIPDGADDTPLLASTLTPTAFPTLMGNPGEICPGSPVPARLQVGMNAFVEPGGVANRVRDNPGKATGVIIGFMQPGAGFEIIGGPECDPMEQIRWWQVDFNGLIGWTAEGELEEYYLMPPGIAGPPLAGIGEIPAGEEVTVSTAPDIAASLDGSVMGIQLDPNIDVSAWRTMLSHVDKMGIDWIKVQVSWRDLEPDYIGQYDAGFQHLVAYLQEAKDRDYRVLLSIAKAPNWARTFDQSEAGPPDDPQSLARFIGRLLERVGAINVDAIEVWNEPNLQREWTGALPFNGGGYMQLFAPVYAAIRDYSEDIVIITAGLAPTDTSAVSVNDREFLSQMYAAGLGNYTDIMIGAHPYGWSNPPDVRCCDQATGTGWDSVPQFHFINNIDDLRAIMYDNGHEGLSVWVTEFGWATWEGLPGTPPEPWMALNTLEEQMLYTLRAFQIGQAREDIGPMFLWNLNYANATTVANGNEIIGYSLLIGDANTPRPLYDALSIRAQP